MPCQTWIMLTCLWSALPLQSTNLYRRTESDAHEPLCQIRNIFSECIFDECWVWAQTPVAKQGASNTTIQRNLSILTQGGPIRHTSVNLLAKICQIPQYLSRLVFIHLNPVWINNPHFENAMKKPLENILQYGCRSAKWFNGHLRQASENRNPTTKILWWKLCSDIRGKAARHLRLRLSPIYELRPLWDDLCERIRRIIPDLWWLWA